MGRAPTAGIGTRRKPDLRTIQELQNAEFLLPERAEYLDELRLHAYRQNSRIWICQGPAYCERCPAFEVASPDDDDDTDEDTERDPDGYDETTDEIEDCRFCEIVEPTNRQTSASILKKMVDRRTGKTH